MGQIVRIVIILLVLWLIFGWIKRTVGRVRQRRDTTNNLPHAEITEMVACAHCGVHVPKRLALSDGVRMYCSKQHRQAEHQG